MVGLSGDEPPRRGLATRIRSIAVDVAPLRDSRNFRLLWIGELVSETGSNIGLVALYIQVYRLTGSAFAVGAIGLVQLVPLVAVTVLGSPLVDRIDRRRLLLVAQAGQVAASGVLLAATLAGHPPIVVVYLGAAAIAGLSGFALSVRTAITPNLVPESQLPSALALNQAMFHTCLIVGPALGGIIVGRFGLAWAYGIDVITFAAGIGTAALMSALPPQREPRAAATDTGTGPEVDDDPDTTSGWASIVAGFRYLGGKRVLQSVFLVDIIAMTFGMPRALFPVLATTQFSGGPEIVGLLFSAVSLGALTGAVTTGWVVRVRRQGLAVLIAVAVWGLGIVGFGLAGDRLAIAMVCLAVAGAADVVSAVFRGTILQTNVPDDLRGRISAVNIVVVTGGPRVGDFEAGVVAALASPAVSVISGGLLCLVGVIALGLAVPSFARYRPGDAV
jgi:MFS family permease